MFEAIMKEVDPEVTFTEVTSYKVPLIEETVFTQLSQKFGRGFSIIVQKDLKTEIRVYGDHSEQFYGKTPDDAIILALQ